MSAAHGSPPVRTRADCSIPQRVPAPVHEQLLHYHQQGKALYKAAAREAEERAYFQAVLDQQQAAAQQKQEAELFRLYQQALETWHQVRPILIAYWLL